MAEAQLKPWLYYRVVGDGSYVSETDAGDLPLCVQRYLKLLESNVRNRPDTPQRIYGDACFCRLFDTYEQAHVCDMIMQEALIFLKAVMNNKLEDI